MTSIVCALALSAYAFARTPHEFRALPLALLGVGAVAYVVAVTS